MVIAVCSVKGAPGVTTLCVALAARWPGLSQPVVVECDPSGGSLAARFGLRSTPGLVSLTAAARQNRDLMLWSHTQPLPGGMPVVVAPPGGDYARAALATLLDAPRQSVSVLRSAATQPGAVVIADCGRLEAVSPAMVIAREADRVLLVVRPRADELSHLAASLSMVDLWAMRPGLVLVGPGHPADEVTRELGVPVLAQVPHDVPGARALSGLPGRRRSPKRSQLGRAAHIIAQRLLEQTAMTSSGSGTSVPVLGTGWNGHASVAEGPAMPAMPRRDLSFPPADARGRDGARLEDWR
jgi:Mrp family chromosome partitioning ATPase